MHFSVSSFHNHSVVNQLYILSLLQVYCLYICQLLMSLLAEDCDASMKWSVIKLYNGVMSVQKQAHKKELLKGNETYETG